MLQSRLFSHTHGRFGSGVLLPWQLPWVTEYWDGRYGITVTGSGVSSWVGMKGVATFSQGTDVNRPSYANSTVTTNGSTTWIQTGAMTLGIPCTVIGYVSQPVWNPPGHIIDGRAGDNTMAAYQYSNSPRIQIYTGASGIVSEPDSGNDWATNTFAVISMCWSTTTNQAFIKTNFGAKRSGTNNSAVSPSGITLGARGINHDQLGNASWKGLAVINGTLTDAQLDATILSISRQY